MRLLISTGALPCYSPIGVFNPDKNLSKLFLGFLGIFMQIFRLYLNHYSWSVCTAGLMRGIQKCSSVFQFRSFGKRHFPLKRAKIVNSFVIEQHPN